MLKITHIFALTIIKYYFLLDFTFYLLYNLFIQSIKERDTDNGKIS